MRDTPETQYVKLRDAHIAYQVLGDGPIDVVFIRGVFNHLEAQWEIPRFATLLRRLASFSRLIIYDWRGSGMSDPLPEGRWPGLEMWVDDHLGLMEEVGSARAAVVSTAGVFFNFVLAAMYPRTVSALVACDPCARLTPSKDYPYGSAEALPAGAPAIEESWGLTSHWAFRNSSAAEAEWGARYMRLVASPGTAAMWVSSAAQVDIREVLRSVRVPTLVLAHDQPNFAPFSRAASRYVADSIPGARYLDVPGSVMGWDWAFPDPDRVADEIQHFLTGVKGEAVSDRVLATVLFTDVVSSTSTAARLGDRRWSSMLDSLDELVARQLDRFKGRLVKGTGDGHLAVFDTPGRAISCGRALLEAAGRLDLELRGGLHTGEIELRGDDIGGLAVAIARRVCDAAGDGELWVSGVVPPLVLGSEVSFTDRGERELKGVPGDWQLYEVAR